jgi:hypothetical protein
VRTRNARLGRNTGAAIAAYDARRRAALTHGQAAAQESMEAQESFGVV